jgi:hypothetical protein
MFQIFISILRDKSPLHPCVSYFIKFKRYHFIHSALRNKTRDNLAFVFFQLVLKISLLYFPLNSKDFRTNIIQKWEQDFIKWESSSPDIAPVSIIACDKFNNYDFGCEQRKVRTKSKHNCWHDVTNGTENVSAIK